MAGTSSSTRELVRMRAEHMPGSLHQPDQDEIAQEEQPSHVIVDKFIALTLLDRVIIDEKQLLVRCYGQHKVVRT